MKRDRVRGTGPRRHQLQTFHKLGEVTAETLADLRSIISEHKHSDIGGDAYKITETMDCTQTHGVDMNRYRQVILQTSLVKSTKSELDYKDWITSKYCLSNLRHDLAKHFNNVYRFRLSEMQPHSKVDWHIDTDTSVACRAQICLSEDDSEFLFKDKHGVHEMKMKPGELWFINTGWNHAVFTHGDVRQTAIFTFLFDDLINNQEIRL